MLTPEQILSGYARGVFPMARSATDDRLYWFSPDPRAILPIPEIHASRSLCRDLRRGGWSAHHAPDFEAIVASCAARPETWINAPLRRTYARLHAQGRAYALEVRKGGALAGGIFGVHLGGAFFGESMFSTQTSGSRMALIWLGWLLEKAGFTLFDTQYLTPHLKSMGGREIPRLTYHRLLAGVLTKPVVQLETLTLPAAAALANALRPSSPPARHRQPAAPQA